jgi:hypothetical protein
MAQGFDMVGFKLYVIFGRLATPVVRFFASRALKPRAAIIESQSKTLRQLIRKARDTRFGRDHGFEKIRDVRDYQASVLVRNYDDFHQQYWGGGFPILDDVTWPGRIPFFAKTSGTTTGKSKFIPCTRAMVRANNRAGTRVIMAHFRAMPKSRVLLGRYFMFAGSPNLEELAPNVFAGELSGIAARETPFWAGRDRYYPPAELAAVTDWQGKLETISEDCVDKNIRAISGLPSWLSILFARMAERSPHEATRLSNWFPNLQLIVHGGMSFEPYRDQFASLTRDLEVDFREVYAASEGFFAVSDGAQDEGMQLITDCGVFYEFIPLDQYQSDNPPRHWLAEVVTGVDYVLVVTTCAGLWSYVVGDIIRFVDVENFRLRFAGRISQTLSKFGEKVLNEEIEAVFAKVAQDHGLELNDFTICPQFEDNKGRYVLLIESKVSDTLPDKVRVAADIDLALQTANSGFATRRLNDVAILPPILHMLPVGSFAAWMERKGQAGGQHKVPRTISEKQMRELMPSSWEV